MRTVELFIGENNKTHKVERDLIIKTCAKYHEGFTIVPAVGYWQGKQENTVAVTIADEDHLIMRTIKELKRVLHQDAIAYHDVAPLEFA